MGFFSSRKQDRDPPLAPVVRSRFHQIKYGKDRERSASEPPIRPSFDRHGKLPVEHSVRPTTDPLTMTLAQRLNELAIANDQGLLDDDEYRLLRQNLFERFTSNSGVPTETPIVKLAHAPAPRVTTNASRPESLRSRVSLTNLSGIFRRATRRPSTDSMSIMSASSSNQFPRRSVSKQPSQASLQPPRDDRNSNRQNVPPSSFSARGIRSMKSRSNTPTPGDPGGEHIQSVTEIRQEIAAVEAEGRRLLDAFNGLELSTLTRTQQRPTIPISSSSMRGDSDTMSVTSNGSMSLKRSPSGRIGSPLVTQPVSLSRKNSFSSVSSRGKSVVNFGPLPPIPSLPSSPLGRLGTAGSTSSINLNRGGHGYFPLATVEEKRAVPLGSLSYMANNDPAIQLLETDMADIRRRREEVVARYEARLEFLRVKLKGAEMHEKLLKR